MTDNQSLKALLALIAAQSQNTVTTPQTVAPVETGHVVGGVEEVGGSPLEDTIRKAFRRYGVEEGLIKAVIKAEQLQTHRCLSCRS